MLRLIHRLQDESPQPIAAGISKRLAQVLWARGVRTPEEAEAFLHPSLSDLHDPMLLYGMGEAVARIRTAIAAGERMVVYGDYDVDGVCATAILVEAFRAHGADVGWYIPSRHREGYGLNADAIRELSQTTRLLITVDCGITAAEETALAMQCGMDVIITDHHEPTEHLPQAVAVVDPLLGAYPFRRLCGAAVALKLAWALFGEQAVENLWELAALATVADLVPLLGENRVIVRHGLEKMQQTTRPGLRALFAVAGLEGKVITAGHLGFQIGPRINAGGRLQEATRNVDLLLTHDKGEAAEIASALNRENAVRQQVEREIVEKAALWVDGNVDFLAERALVVSGRDWNTGVVGLAASKLVERYGWPAIVLSESDEGILTGSARSIPGVNIHKALTACADLFIRFGGHAQAAGMTLRAQDLAAFRARLNDAIGELAEPDAFVPSAGYDLEATLPEITIPMIEEFSLLAPTGFGNPSPVFCAQGVEIIEARAVGSDGKHLKLRLAQDECAVDGIAFGQGDARATLPDRVDVLFSPTVNEYMGRRSAQCEVARIVAHAPTEAFYARCLRERDAFDLYWVEREGRPEGEDAASADVVRAALEADCQGTILLVRTLAGAEKWLRWLQAEGLADRVDYCFGQPDMPQRFNTLCVLPQDGAAKGFRQAFALDDALVRESVGAWLPTDDDLRTLYKALRAGQGRFASERALAQAAGLRQAAVRLGLRVLAELELVEYRAVPFAAAMLPARKCDLGDSRTLSTIRRTWAWEERV